MKKQIAILVVLCSSTLFAQESKHFIILHTNDTHGHLLPFSLPERMSLSDSSSKIQYRTNIGGVARRATVINDIRARNKNVYYLDAGDNMNGSAFSLEYRDHAEYDILNALECDCAVFGNNDFDIHTPELRAIQGSSKFPIVFANVYERGATKLVAEPYVIQNWDGLRVAIIGLVTESTSGETSAQESFDVRLPIDIAKALVPQVRAKADLVILLTHIGFKADQEIARAVPGIDLIVGGHSHTRLSSGVYVNSTTSGVGDAKGTLIVQDGYYTPELGKLDFTVQNEGTRWHISKYSESLIPLTNEIKSDPAVDSIVNRYWQPMEAKYSEVLGVATDEFSTADGGQRPTVYLLADALANAGPCQFALEPFGPRSPLPKGTVTLMDVAYLYPYTDTIVTCQITGTNFEKMLQEHPGAPSATLKFTSHHFAKPLTPDKEYVYKDILLNGRPLSPDSVYSFNVSKEFADMIAKYVSKVRLLSIGTLTATANYIQMKKMVSPEFAPRVDHKED